MKLANRKHLSQSVLALVASRVCVIGACVGLLLLCSCAWAPLWYANDSVRPPLPAETSFNKGAGCGDLVYLTLRLETGEELLFLVETGAPFTLLDKSLEPKLGKRLGTMKVKWPGGKGTGSIYKAPKLYLGSTQLVTASRVVTLDVSPMPFPGRPQRGILGMDCLRHYCIQLDFAERKMRFLDPDDPGNEDLGQALPLKIFFGKVFTPENLVGVKGEKSQIDTGCNFDGTLKPKLFRPELREQAAVLTNGMGLFPKGVWRGETYTNLNVTEWGGFSGRHNLLGLRFLARHKVTLNFPKRTMYLQRESVGPLAVERSSTNILGSTLGWWETEGLSPSGDDKESLAARILSAPNLRPGAPDAFSKVFSWDPPRLISVGPPGAKLRVVHMPPGNYRMKVVSEVGRGADGEGELSFEGRPDYKRLSSVPMQREGTILLLHDYNYQKEHMVLWAWVLAQAGYHVFLVDLRGHGESSGPTISYGKYETTDLGRVLDRLTEQRLCDGTVGVLGVGYGANLALHWAARDPRVRTVVAIAPHNQPEQAFERMAREHESSISPEVLQEALSLVAAQLDIKWADWSGAAALRQNREPVLLIGGGKDTICTTNDLQVLEQVAPSGSKSLLIPEADHGNIRYWFHEIEEPVKAWFQEHLPAPPDGQVRVIPAEQQPVERPKAQTQKNDPKRGPVKSEEQERAPAQTVLKLSGEWSLRVNAFWEKIADSTCKLHENPQLAHYFDFKAARERQDYDAGAFSAFLSGAPVSVGDIWRLDDPPSYEHNRFGAVFVPCGEQSDDLVAHVLDGSPPSEAGIRNGDGLLRIGEHDVTKWRTESWGRWSDLLKHRPGTKLELTLRRGDETYKTTALLREILAPQTNSPPLRLQKTEE